MPVGKRIYSNFTRPSRELVEQFRGLPTANIADCMGRISCIDTEICPLNHTPLLGAALTVKVPGGDNLMFHKALEMAQEGDILVINGFGDMTRSLCGELMATMARQKGIRGFVIDGCVRDLESFAGMTDFACYARGITPNGPYKNGPGEIGLPVAVGHQVIFSGDILVGDEDGVVVIRPDDASAIAREARAILEAEQQKRVNYQNGKCSLDWVNEKLRALNLEEGDG